MRFKHVGAVALAGALMASITALPAQADTTLPPGAIVYGSEWSSTTVFNGGYYTNPDPNAQPVYNTRGDDAIIVFGCPYYAYNGNHPEEPCPGSYTIQLQKSVSGQWQNMDTPITLATMGYVFHPPYGKYRVIETLGSEWVRWVPEMDGVPGYYESISYPVMGYTETGPPTPPPASSPAPRRVKVSVANRKVLVNVDPNGREYWVKLQKKTTSGYKTIATKRTVSTRATFKPAPGRYRVYVSGLGIHSRSVVVTSKPTSASCKTRTCQQAVRMAKNYLVVMPFSRKGLIAQLKYEGFSTSVSTRAVDSLHKNWNTQAARMAERYLDVMPFSRSGLIQQLEYEGFTHSQAVYGVNRAGL